MNDNAESWLYPDLESCCKRYYSWDEVGCLRTNAEATLVSSSGSALAFPDPTADLYYPAWGTTESCVNDGAAPAYMTKQPDTWMHGKHGCLSYNDTCFELECFIHFHHFVFHSRN